jgi:hypothetical protein
LGLPANASAAMGELNTSRTVQFEIESCSLARDACTMHALVIKWLGRILGPILHVNYPSVQWLDHFATAPSKIINRVVGEYDLFAVGVRVEREGAVHYWGSANAVPRNRFSIDLKAAIFDFDQEFFETADAAANYAIERAISIISNQR